MSLVNFSAFLIALCAADERRRAAIRGGGDVLDVKRYGFGPPGEEIAHYEQQRDVALEANRGLRPDDAQKQAHVIFANNRGLTLPRAERADHALEPEADLLSTRRIVETGSAVQRTDRPDCLADRSRRHRLCAQCIDAGGGLRAGTAAPSAPAAIFQLTRPR